MAWELEGNQSACFQEAGFHHAAYEQFVIPLVP